MQTSWKQIKVIEMKNTNNDKQNYIVNVPYSHVPVPV